MSSGSIPARTGEPILVPYVKVHGTPTGLSPRVRGNPLGMTARTSSKMGPRSIPARTGEPDKRPAIRVLPTASGLSPRVRGNRPPPSPSISAENVGSIPARTGEPHKGVRPSATSAVGSIPARTGEPVSARLLIDVPNLQGLSPRVRGNLDSSARYLRNGCRVYPRAYGGTGAALLSGARVLGKVYPRAYGGTVRYVGGVDVPGSGSIPARTGEPDTASLTAVRAAGAVYPRAYGGTEDVTTCGQVP